MSQLKRAEATSEAAEGVRSGVGGAGSASATGARATSSGTTTAACALTAAGGADLNHEPREADAPGLASDPPIFGILGVGAGRAAASAVSASEGDSAGGVAAVGVLGGREAAAAEGTGATPGVAPSSVGDGSGFDVSRRWVAGSGELDGSWAASELWPPPQPNHVDGLASLRAPCLSFLFLIVPASTLSVPVTGGSAAGAWAGEGDDCWLSARAEVVGMSVSVGDGFSWSSVDVDGDTDVSAGCGLLFGRNMPSSPPPSPPNSLVTTPPAPLPFALTFACSARDAATDKSSRSSTRFIAS